MLRNQFIPFQPFGFFKSLIGLSLLLAFTTKITVAQNFTSSAQVAIPDNDPAGVSSNINVSGLSQSTLSTTLGVVRVCVDITHPRTKDLALYLESPSGQYIILSSQHGTGANYTGTCFMQTIGQQVGLGSNPFSGNHKPDDELGVLNSGATSNGTWVLTVRDSKNDNTGTLNSWEIAFSSNAPSPQNLNAGSTLPLVVINTNGVEIDEQTKITANFKIINHNTGLHRPSDTPQFDGTIGIEYRGDNANHFPMRSFSFETRTGTGGNLDTMLLGMSSDNDWILYAPYNDKSLMRNVLAYSLHRLTGHYAARGRFCEVVLNGRYIGLYVLMETIKQKKDRVDIANLTSANISGNARTGGYIIQVDQTTGTTTDGWNSAFNKVCMPTTSRQYIEYAYPSADDIVTQQKAYIQSFVDSFEVALSGTNFQDPTIGFRKFADEMSFIDHMLIAELAKNVDAYRRSTYLYKDKYSVNNKLHAGPVWDYNAAFANNEDLQGDQPSGWVYDCSNGLDTGMPFWWARMMQDNAFNLDFRCRYSQLRNNGIFSTTNVDRLVDSMATFINTAQSNHFARWPVLGVDLDPNPISPTTYQAEVDNLKAWFVSRLAWMDSQLLPVTGCTLSAEEAGKTHLSISPNPVAVGQSLTLHINLESTEEVSFQVFDMIGNRVHHYSPTDLPAGEQLFNIPTDLPAGVYVIAIEVGDERVYKKICVQ